MRVRGGERAAVSGICDPTRDPAACALGRIPAKSEQHPSLRKPRRSEPAVLRIGVDLEDVEPPIWRRLDVRSDIGLDVFHQVLQDAFGWTDSHLHRFALGGSPFDQNTERFLYPYDAEEGEDDGTPAKM
jgi:hypothetical protein